MKAARLMAASLGLWLAAAACGDVPRDEGGGLDGFADGERTTPAERTLGPGPGVTAVPGTIAVSDEDRAFLEEVSRTNRVEVVLGNMAEDEAESAEATQLGEQIAADHAAAQRNLLASRIIGGDTSDSLMPTGGLQPDLTGEAGEIQRRLEALGGAAFDRAFLEQLATLHEEALRRSEEHARQTESAYVRELIAQMRSIQERHLERIRTLRGQTPQR